MTLGKVERFGLLDALVAEMTESEAWTTPRANALLLTFGLEPSLEDHWSLAEWQATLASALAGAVDEDLIDLHRTVFPEARAVPEEAVPQDSRGGPWQRGMIRLFISHLDKYKHYAAQVRGNLATRGVHGFVAHDSIDGGTKWQREIETALNTADAFVGLVHEGFGDSAYTNQEVGWAMSRGIPILFIRLGENPPGFAREIQAVPAHDAKNATRHIMDFLNRQPTLAVRLGDALIRALGRTHSFDSAWYVAQDIAQFTSLTDDQWAALDDVYLTNDQVHGGRRPSTVLNDLYARNGRRLPEVP